MLRQIRCLCYIYLVIIQLIQNEIIGREGHERGVITGNAETIVTHLIYEEMIRYRTGSVDGYH